MTIFLSSHLLGEVAHVAQRIGIIHQGRLIEEMDVTQLERNRRTCLVVRTRDEPGGMAILAGAGYHVHQRDDLLEIVMMRMRSSGPTRSPSSWWRAATRRPCWPSSKRTWSSTLRLVGMEEGAA